jgi:hypothetical protein
MIGESWSSGTISAAAGFKSGSGLMTWSRSRSRDERFPDHRKAIRLKATTPGFGSLTSRWRTGSQPRPPSSGVFGGGVFGVTLVVIPTGVSASGAGYPPTIPSECETEPDHPDPEDEMQEVIGSVHGHEVGRRFLADDEPVHEQH